MTEATKLKGDMHLLVFFFAFRVLWFLILGFMWYELVGGCLAQICRYSKFITLTQDTVRYEQSIRFPAVTICNLNKIRKEQVTDLRDKVIFQNMFLKEPNRTELLEFPGEEYIKNFSLREALLKGSMRVNETYLSCVRPWNGVLRTCSPIERFAGDDYCHTLNAREGNNTLTLNTWYTDLFYGMYLLLWLQQDKYFISYGLAAGFNVLDMLFLRKTIVKRFNYLVHISP